MSVSQTQFRTAILDASLPVPDGLRDGQGAPAGRRFNVYRNNVAVSLTEALEMGFPVIRKLIGDENFKMVSGVFLRACPPSSPIMMYYGAEFPEFLSDFKPLESIGYLADVARIEQAIRQSYHAADSTPIAPPTLAKVPPDDLTDLVLTLAPSVKILSSPWPIHDIWSFNMRNDAPKPRHMAQDVAVLRTEFDPEPILLPHGGATFLTALERGATLGAALEAVADDHFDLSSVLGILLNNNSITAMQIRRDL